MASDSPQETTEPAQPTQVDESSHDQTPAMGTTSQHHMEDADSKGHDYASAEHIECRQTRPAYHEDSESTENRLRPAADVINRIIWDPQYDSTDYTIGYEDRFEGRLEAGLDSWKRDLTDEEFIPQHRILYIKRRSNHEIVWDRRRRIDKVFNSGNSAYSWLAFLT